MASWDLCGPPQQASWSPAPSAAANVSTPPSPWAWSPWPPVGPGPWSQTIGKILLGSVALLAIAGDLLSGPVTAVIAVAGFLAIVLLLQLLAGAAQTTAGLHRIEVLGKDRPARAWAVVKIIDDDKLTLSDLVAWPRRQGAGRALVEAVCNSADHSGRAVHLKATNPALAAFYERAGFARTPSHRIRAPGIPMIHPYSHDQPIPAETD